jgi:hypothetical protein
MFQFQAWLLGEGKRFRRAGLIFASALISDHVSRQRAKWEDEQESSYFVRAFASEHLNDVIHHGFDGFTLDDLLSGSNFPLGKQEHDEALKEIAELNALTAIRIRLDKAGEPASLTRAFELSPRLVPNKPGRTKLGAIHRKRLNREPFLYAACLEAPQFLTLEFPDESKKTTMISAGDLLSQVQAKARNTQAFRNLCSIAKEIARIIESPLSKELSDAWAGIEPRCPPVEPIPPDLVEKRPRRSAEETKAGKRQRVK